MFGVNLGGYIELFFKIKVKFCRELYWAIMFRNGVLVRFIYYSVFRGFEGGILLMIGFFFFWFWCLYSLDFLGYCGLESGKGLIWKGFCVEGRDSVVCFVMVGIGCVS